MAKITFNGSAGRLEGEYHLAIDASRANRPVALLLSPHPRLGGSMNSPIVQHLFEICIQQGLSVLRFNFRGVGRSEGEFGNGKGKGNGEFGNGHGEFGNGEIVDAASALDWLQAGHKSPTQFWVFGYSFGAWVGMQLLMRRPEINNFVSVAPPANIYDFTFLAPCPSPGLIVHGGSDKIATPSSVRELISRLKAQRGIEIMHKEIPGANHLFDRKTPDMIKTVNNYLSTRL